LSPPAARKRCILDCVRHVTQLGFEKYFFGISPQSVPFWNKIWSRRMNRNSTLQCAECAHPAAVEVELGFLLCDECEAALISAILLQIASDVRLDAIAPVTNSAPTVAGALNSSSGDGPSIQQPRSIRQGRARDRVTCSAIIGNSIPEAGPYGFDFDIAENLPRNTTNVAPFQRGAS
jgi:hypothetical protein